MSESWAQWEGEVIHGRFALVRFLGGSEHSGVFLTDFPAQGLANAAIRIVPSEPAAAEETLARWGRAAALSHPHLVRLLESGRCQRSGRPYLYVVMDYAAETLAEILPQRSLTADEVRALLRPVLEVLAFLHGRGLVHGRLRPSGVLVIDDTVKLASDAIRPAGAPEAGSVATAEDMASDLRALGATVV